MLFFAPFIKWIWQRVDYFNLPGQEIGSICTEVGLESNFLNVFLKLSIMKKNDSFCYFLSS